MTDTTPILARMAQRPIPVVADPPLSTSRAVGLAMSRAADRVLQMQVTVADVVQDTAQLDGLMAGLPDGFSYMRLERAGALVGIIGVDTQLRAATIEFQTMGRVANAVAVDRPQTGKDLMMLAPLVAEFLDQMAGMVQSPDYAGWTQDLAMGARFDNLRAAGLAMQDSTYRKLQVSVDLIAEQRPGQMVMALPVMDHVAVVDAPADFDSTWDARMHDTVSAAPAALQAVLHRISLPLGVVDGLEIGDVLPLYGATVGSVRLYAPDSKLVGTARLGQSAGLRAVRIEVPAKPAMRDIPAPKAAVLAP